MSVLKSTQTRFVGISYPYHPLINVDPDAQNPLLLDISESVCKYCYTFSLYG